STGSLLAMQPDGKLIVGGMLDLNTGTDPYIARLNPDGSLDSTFSIGPFLGLLNTVHGIALDRDGRILVAGELDPHNGSGSLEFSVCVLLSNGSPDTSIGPGGRIQDDFLGVGSEARAVVPAPGVGGADDLIAVGQVGAGNLLRQT